MKLAHKIGKFARGEAYRRSWRRLRRKLHPIPLRPLLAKLDHNRLREIQARYPYSPVKASKYTDVERWLKVNIERVQDLQLNELPPQEILDLGCGGGFFLFIARELGHRCLGLDFGGTPVYDDLIGLLGVERQIWEIKPYEPLPDLGRKFDWITGFSTAFNRHADRSIWGPQEWRFFLQDLNKHLRPGGRIFFALNPAHRGWYYTDELRDFLLSCGAIIERERVYFPNGALVP